MKTITHKNVFAIVLAPFKCYFEHHQQ